MLHFVHRFLLWVPAAATAFLGGLAALYEPVREWVWTIILWCLDQMTNPLVTVAVIAIVLAYAGLVIWTSDRWQNRIAAKAGQARPSSRLKCIKIEYQSDAKAHYVVSVIQNTGTETVSVDGHASELTSFIGEPDREKIDRVAARTLAAVEEWVRKRRPGFDISPGQCFVVGRDQPIDPDTWKEFQKGEGRLITVSLVVVYRTENTPPGRKWQYEFMASMKPDEAPYMGYRDTHHLIRRPLL